MTDLPAFASGPLPSGPLPSGALSGVRIVDTSGVAAGPFGTMLLADLGADVIKVERPGRGDDSRRLDVNYRGGESGYYLGINKNKRSIALDLADPDDRGVLDGLLARADVFVESFRPGRADKLGLGFDAVHARHPALVYCSVKGYGRVGPSAALPGYDLLAQAVGGLMDITGEADGPPARSGAPVADLATGIYAALGILAALRHAERTGEGQHLTVSLVGSALSLLAPYTVSAAFGTPFRRCGSAHSTIAPYQAFQGRDEAYFIVAAANDSLWSRLCVAIGLDPDRLDPRFASNEGRARHRGEGEATLQAVFSTRDADHWVGVIRAAGVPTCRVETLGEALASEEWRANGYLADVAHPTAGEVPVVVAPLQLSRTPVTVRSYPPRLDEHGTQIRGEAAASSASAFDAGGGTAG